MLIRADARSIPLRDGCVQCVVTSPPYFFLRDYGVDGQIGLEPTRPESRPIPLRAAFAHPTGLFLLRHLRLRQDLVQQRASQPGAPANRQSLHSGCRCNHRTDRQYQGSVRRRTRRMVWRKESQNPSIFNRTVGLRGLQVPKQANGHRLVDSVQAASDAGGAHDAPFGLTRNRRTVWTIPTMPYAGAHFATMPEALVEPCILAGARLGDLVFDPFMGSGTVGAVAERMGRRWVGTDLNPAYHALAKKRTSQRGLRWEGGCSAAS